MSRNASWAKYGTLFGWLDDFLRSPGDARGRLIGWLYIARKKLNMLFGYVPHEEYDNLFPIW